ncbi:acetoacetyl-CoA synthetase [Coprinopsis marcescibilis]|uniref:Acetoacetyl-CoA synthetase n=1 Tax=Coprinopsis marcescibilis TaxID=230819 RepID=A0A5C3L1U1_COPMA|nr:acetoacetyl-CoA synthetase [Coprinopsis marcescibilis]
MTDSGYFAQSRILCQPTHPRLTNVEALRRYVNRKHGLNLNDYHDLHKYSVEDYAFWMDLWEHLGIISSTPPNPKRITEPGSFPQVPNWFPGARLNFAENLLRRRDDGIAITEAGDSGVVTNYTYRELYERVRLLSNALRANGLAVGDRVAAIVTNSINAIVIATAVASLGGIFSSTATDMGAQGILDRYRQIQPKFVFAETEAFYAGKRVDLLPKAKEVILDLKAHNLRRAILLPSRISGKELSLPDVPMSSTLAEFVTSGDLREPLVFEQLPFSTPLFILYSSGTSGKPKCIVHTAGGVLLQTKKEICLALDVGRDDTLFQYTTTGWMMWTYMVTGLSAGLRLVLYDGSPFYPDVQTYLKFINDQGVSIFGTSPRFLAEVQGRGIKPCTYLVLSNYPSPQSPTVINLIFILVALGAFDSMRTMSVTGAVLTPPMFEWTHQAFGGRFHLVSTSGGTDICSAFVTGIPSLPVHSGEIQGKSLGMKVEVFDPTGNNMEHTSQAGELVCTRPHPSMPLGFWGDDLGHKFSDAYFNMYPNIWRQGDFMVVNPQTKGIMILGRSDGVLNPSGVRFGSGEIYSVLETFSGHIDDSLCVGQRRSHDQDERVILFLKLRPGKQLTPHLISEIRAAIRTGLSARHVPAYIFEVPEIPYTVNGKKIEIAVKQIISGSNLQPSGTVANPESLKLYYKYRDIEKLVGVEKAKL